jgi:DNA-binding response OmpR family regulator
MQDILFIDDDLQICEVVGEFLRRNGFAVRTANDGGQGLLAAATEVPDLILCDVKMPRLNGHDFLSTLRQDAKLGNVPVIFLSGCVEHKEIRRSMNLGGDDFISKSATLPEILEAVRARLFWRQKWRLPEGQPPGGGKTPPKPDKPDSKSADPFPSTPERPEARKVRIPVPMARKDPSPIREDNRDPFVVAKSANRRQCFKLSEVKAVTADGEYSMVHWGQEQHAMFRKALKQWEKELPPESFIRVHRGAIINLGFLNFVEKSHGHSGLQVHLHGFKGAIPVSQRATSEFNRFLKKFQSS